jgi:hypothetical protein
MKIRRLGLEFARPEGIAGNLSCCGAAMFVCCLSLKEHRDRDRAIRYLLEKIKGMIIL